jgi:lipopolysaccharide/colanic/teichoic acid biosynthesis glycosyltransferase
MTPWEKIMKRLADILLSIFGLLLLSPILLVVALKVKRSSKGSIFFLQDRVGVNGNLFSIIKFRSMIENAENGTPRLSSENDERITPFGKTMRKYRIDELPQLWNVLKGDMSLVGPRPERKFFIDQIIQTAPQYQLLQRVKTRYYFAGYGEVWLCFHPGRNAPAHALRFALHRKHLLSDGCKNPDLHCYDFMERKREINIP